MIIGPSAPMSSAAFFAAPRVMSVSRQMSFTRRSVTRPGCQPNNSTLVFMTLFHPNPDFFGHAPRVGIGSSLTTTDFHLLGTVAFNYLGHCAILCIICISIHRIQQPYFCFHSDRSFPSSRATMLFTSSSKSQAATTRPPSLSKIKIMSTTARKNWLKSTPS